MIENLPRDIALDILSRLPIISIIQMKSVCKAWYALTRDGCLPGMYDARANNKNPGLILHCDCLKRNKLYFLDCGKGPDKFSNKVRRIDTKLKSLIPEYQVVGSCNGLICIADALYFNPMIVCNPLTGNLVELPKSNEYPERERISRFLHLAETWRSLGSLPLSLDQNPSEALLNGALQWCLSAAVCGSDGVIEIRIMKEYNVKESWMKDYVIGTYLPISLNQTASRPPWKKSTQSKGDVQVVCNLKNGEILLQYMNGALVLYNPENEEFKDLLIPGLPKWFCTIVHVESLFFVQRNEI
ncbi:hypothetical protein REPUB_Repub11eG0126200 [Reevesia pubescens]